MAKEQLRKVVSFSRESIVKQRARYCCEFCQLHDKDTNQPLIIEEITSDEVSEGRYPPLPFDTFILICAECSLARCSYLSAIVDGPSHQLFHPRKEHWQKHFRWDKTTLVGKTQTGQVTIQALHINEPSRILRRESLALQGKFPR